MSDRLVRGVAEYALCTVVPIGDDSIERLADDGVVGRFDEGGEAHLGLMIHLCIRFKRNGRIQWPTVPRFVSWPQKALFWASGSANATLVCLVLDRLKINFSEVIWTRIEDFCITGAASSGGGGAICWGF